MEVVLKNLPKLSLNKWYAGVHWTKRKEIKDLYYLLVKSQFKEVLKASGRYSCIYDFYFKSRPLDASNCIAMVKLIEDIIFEDDNYKIVKEIKISSNKSNEDKVIIKIKNYGEYIS